MIKTSYQKPELRDANDEIVQEGAFGKNTALSNSTNDGWIDYVMNNLEALHDIIGDSAPTLDANGHVVEPANLAIGDEDGNRIKDSYLKLSGGKVTGVASFRTDLRMLDNQDNRWGGLYVPGTTSSVQYLSLYCGTRATGDARLNLYSVGNGKFELTGYSTDSANAYTLTHDNSGNLNWRGYPLAWKKDYLPLAGGTMTGVITSSSEAVLRKPTTDAFLMLCGSTAYSTGAHLKLYGRDAATNSGAFLLYATDANDSQVLRGRPDGSLTWGGNSIALSKDVLPLAGGRMTGNIGSAESSFIIYKTDTTGDARLYSSSNTSNGASLIVYGKDETSRGGRFVLTASDGTNTSTLDGRPNGTLIWGGKNVERVFSSDTTYIRYESGLQICFGRLSSISTSGTALTYPVAFNSVPRVIFLPVTSTVALATTALTATSVTVKSASGTVAADYIAIGKWK